MVYVYKLTFPSNKVYIGITNNWYKRWSDHISISKSSKLQNQLYKALRKYSPENVKWEIIDYAEDYATAHELEIAYIQQYNSFKCGYNATLGGDGVSKWTKEALKLEARKYNRKIDFKVGNQSAYVILNTYKQIDKNFYDKCISHFVSKRKKQNKKWSIEKLISSVSDYKCIVDICHTNKPLYAALGRLRRSNITKYNQVILSLTM